jgi:hypothetical protein
LAKTTLCEDRREGLNAFLSVRYNKWKLTVTIRPPKIIPLAKSGGKRISPIILATENRIQFE